jgi:hypothetical protein
MKTIGICASGPSLTFSDCDYLKDHVDELIVVNDTWRMVTADHLYAADTHWWLRHASDINCGFSGKRWSCQTQGKTNWGSSCAEELDVNLLNIKTYGGGLSTVPNTIIGGGNSGYQAIGLSLHLGATRVILLGYDMTWTAGKAHWFGMHPKV